MRRAVAGSNTPVGRPVVAVVTQTGGPHYTTLQEKAPGDSCFTDTVGQAAAQERELMRKAECPSQNLRELARGELVQRGAKKQQALTRQWETSAPAPSTVSP